MNFQYYILTYGKMTKRFLMSLPEGAYIVSGVLIELKDKVDPRMAEYVVPMEKREQQWQKIKEVFCNNRQFLVFKDKQDWDAYKNASAIPYL